MTFRRTISRIPNFAYTQAMRISSGSISLRFHNLGAFSATMAVTSACSSASTASCAPKPQSSLPSSGSLKPCSRPRVCCRNAATRRPSLPSPAGTEPRAATRSTRAREGTPAAFSVSTSICAASELQKPGTVSRRLTPARTRFDRSAAFMWPIVPGINGTSEGSSSSWSCGRSSRSAAVALSISPTCCSMDPPSDSSSLVRFMRLANTGSSGGIDAKLHFGSSRTAFAACMMLKSGFRISPFQALKTSCQRARGLPRCNLHGCRITACSGLRGERPRHPGAPGSRGAGLPLVP
mmetsp:Transcript_78325/g.253703  ORF Transcript_78325/g.253703 Transcript_78325/m.253703 type:complete len:293 (+) Transcript_78325:561-1439(+)